MAATEPPSARRLREAREQGRTPRSALLAPSGVLTALGLSCLAQGEALWDALEAMLTSALRLERPYVEASAMAAASLRESLSQLGLWLTAGLALSLLLQLVQVGFVFARRAPSGPVRAPLAGFASGLLSAGVWTAAVLVAFRQALDLAWLEASTAASVLQGALWTVLLGGALVAAIDVARSRQAFFDGLKLTRHEAQRERRLEQGPEPMRRKQRALARGPRQ